MATAWLLTLLLYRRIRAPTRPLDSCLVCFTSQNTPSLGSRDSETCLVQTARYAALAGWFDQQHVPPCFSSKNNEIGTSYVAAELV
jgi:hypothetical protein